MKDFYTLYANWKRNNDSVTKEDLQFLYDTAKDSYYSGDELIPDTDFDAIEDQLGNTNKGYVGSKTGNYTEKHSFIMGSLAKVQIKEDKKDKTVDWDGFAAKLNTYMAKARGITAIEVTPKLDGCSFSAEFINENDEAVLISCATRGDGTYGTDISHWFKSVVKSSYWDMIDAAVTKLCRKNSGDIFCVRGEVLIPLSSFGEKYQSSFTNPRSFVAGCLGQKWEDKAEQIEYSGDLHFVCYDYRLFNKVTGKYTELDWMCPTDPNYAMLKPFLGHVGELPSANYCRVISSSRISGELLAELYEEYDDFRQNTTEYALDGVVFKPNVSARQYNENRSRPVDCVAMKFMPMMNPTEIVDIKWTVGKDGEYTPIAIIDTIKLDGKDINKASMHNYNYIVKHNVGIGSKIRVSMAGDIIPFIYEIVEPAGIDNINLPEDSYVVTDKNSGCLHLMKNFTEEGRAKNNFMASAKALNITNIGPAAASAIWDALHTDWKAAHSDLGDTLCNIIQIIPKDVHQDIIYAFGEGKSVQNILASLNEYAKRIELSDVIKSFCFKSCGDRASVLCAKLLCGQNASTASFPAESYMWAKDVNSEQYKTVMNAVNFLGIKLEAADDSANADLIPIIMTGSPKEFGYATKKEFLAAHPEFTETTNWKDCKCLYTDDLASTSSKMTKAKKAGIPIRTYDQNL